MFDKDAIEALQRGAAIGQANKAIAELSNLGVIALPNDYTRHDLEQYQELRRRARGTMDTSNDDDFAAYVKEHSEAGSTVFIDDARMSATAVLNLGTPDGPGHADNKAILTLRQTAAYSALRSTANGQGKTQTDIAEFIEDWQDIITCRHDDQSIDVRKAIGVIRNITIEALRKVGNEEQQLSAQRTTLESVKASSIEQIPTVLSFQCVPYFGMEQRRFDIRLSILTNDKPMIVLRIIKQEQHTEDMGRELAKRVRDKLDHDADIVIGSYAAGK